MECKPTLSVLTNYSTGKLHFLSVDLREVREVRAGKRSKDFERWMEEARRHDNNVCFVLLYGTEFRLKTLSLAGNGVACQAWKSYSNCLEIRIDINLHTDNCKKEIPKHTNFNYLTPTKFIRRLMNYTCYTSKIIHYIQRYMYFQ